MKRYFMYTAALVLLPILAYAQFGDLRISKVRVSSGRGALTSGLDIFVSFSGEGRELGITGNAERVYAVYGWDILPALTISASGGFFKNTPWLGPQLKFKVGDHLSLLHWSGISTGEPEHPAPEVNFFFTFTGSYLSWSDFTASFASQKLMDNEWWYLPGFAYNPPIGDRAHGIVGVDYNTVTEEVYFRLGVKYTFK